MLACITQSSDGTQVYCKVVKVFVEELEQRDITLTMICIFFTQSHLQKVGGLLLVYMFARVHMCSKLVHMREAVVSLQAHLHHLSKRGS